MLCPILLQSCKANYLFKIQKCVCFKSLTDEVPEIEISAPSNSLQFQLIGSNGNIREKTKTKTVEISEERQRQKQWKYKRKDKFLSKRRILKSLECCW